MVLRCSAPSCGIGLAAKRARPAHLARHPLYSHQRRQQRHWQQRQEQQQQQQWAAVRLRLLHERRAVSEGVLDG